jgi:hypothetical protein
MLLRVLFIVIFLNSVIFSKAQTPLPVKWKKYLHKAPLKTQHDDNQSNYYLINYNSENAPKKRKLQRVLDNEFGIIYLSSEEVPRLKKQNVLLWKANDLWKYTNNLTNYKSDKINRYIVKTNSPSKLTELIAGKTWLNIIKKIGSTFIIEGQFKEINNHISNAKHIYYIGLESFNPKQESKIAELDLSMNGINKVHHEYKNLNGTGQIISIKDNMFDETDPDLVSKYKFSPTASSMVDAHATAMATIASGAGNTSIKGKGVAYNCQLTSSDYNSLFPDNIEQLLSLEANIQNHSYGTEIENFYGEFAHSYDDFCYKNPTFLHLFSSGNSGEETPINGNYSGIANYANLTGNFKMAKNSLCIGAMDFEEKTAIFSSRGPAFDGRIKPELVAYSFVGTSNATALVSGTSILLQEQYKNQNGESAPSSLLKACLINSADDIDNVGPDFTSGYGNMNAYNALKIINNSQFILDEVQNNESKDFLINVPANSKNLKVTLVWTDPPANENSNIALINDLDLKVMAPDASEWLPWVLDASPNLENLVKPATRQTDRLNNVEQVTISDLQEGTYTVHIQGFDISTSAQKFAIAYEWEAKENFEWIYPTGSDAIAFGEIPQIKIKWRNTYDIDYGNLLVSYDYGKSWKSINNEAFLNKNSFLWQPANTINSAAILKMVINETEYLSDTFVITSETNTKVSLDCDDVAELRWKQHSNALFYEVYHFQNNEMQAIANTSDTSFTFYKSDYAGHLFAVEPVFENFLTGQRSEAIDYTNFEANCYFDSFYAISETEENGIDVFFEIGSDYAIKKMELLKVNSIQKAVLAEYESFTSLSFTFLDANPLEGFNQYQLKITLDDGTEYFSEPISAYFLSERPFLLFPNPATKEGISVYTKNLGENVVRFSLYTLSGQKVLNKQLSSDRDFINLKLVGSGTYIYKIESSNGISESSVLIVR